MKRPSYVASFGAAIAIVAALIISPFGAAAPAMAAPVSLLSNLSAGSNSYVPLATGWTEAQKFTTPDTQRFRLTGVTASFLLVDNFQYRPTFDLRADNGGVPGAMIAPLGSVTVTQTMYHTFEDSEVELDANTSYWIVMTGQSVSSSGANGGLMLTTLVPTGSYGFVAAPTRGSLFGGVWRTTSNYLPVISLQGEPIVVPATATVTAQGSSPTSASSVNWHVGFDVPVSGLDASRFALDAQGVSGAAITSVEPVGALPATSWTVVASTGSGSGTLGLSLASSPVGFEVAGLPVVGAAVVVDRESPTVDITLAPGQANLAKDAPVDFDITFSELVTGFTGAGIDFAGSDPVGGYVYTVTGSGAEYRLSVSGGLAQDGSLVVGVKPGAAADLAGNPSSGSNTAAVLIDVTPPEPVITGPSGETSDDRLPIEIGMTEQTTDLDPASVVVVGGMIENPSAPGQTITFDVVPSGAGVVTVTFPAGAVVDPAGNSNVAGELSFTYKPVPPEPEVVAPELLSATGGSPLVSIVGASAGALLLAAGALLVFRRRVRH